MVLEARDASSPHRQQSEEGDKNGSEDDDEEKPGKRVMGPRKKFVWDDKLRLEVFRCWTNNKNKQIGLIIL